MKRRSQEVIYPLYVFDFKEIIILIIYQLLTTYITINMFS